MSEKINNIDQENTEGMFARVFHRMQIIRNYKDDLLNVLNNLQGAGWVISKIQHGSVITKSDHNLLKNFIKNRGLSTDVSSVYERTLTSLDKEGTLNDLNNFTQLIEKYPFVVNADEVRENIGNLLGDGISEIRKDGKWGLVKKEKLSGGEDAIRILFNPEYSQAGTMTFLKEEYDKYGLIEVRNTHKEYTFQNTYDTMFLQKVDDPENGGTWYFKDIGRYKMLQRFDRDNIGFSMLGGGCYQILHKDISPQGIKIYEIGRVFKSDGPSTSKGFDDFNTFEAEIEKFGKVIFKKRYDTSGNLIGITTFKKSRFDKEEIIDVWDINNTK